MTPSEMERMMETYLAESLKAQLEHRSVFDRVLEEYRMVTPPLTPWRRLMRWVRWLVCRLGDVLIRLGCRLGGEHDCDD